MAGRLGEIPLAAHVTMQNLQFFTFPIPFGVSMAGTVRVGNLLGAGNGKQVQPEIHRVDP